MSSLSSLETYKDKVFLTNSCASRSVLFEHHPQTSSLKRRRLLLKQAASQTFDDPATAGKYNSDATRTILQEIREKALIDLKESNT